MSESVLARHIVRGAFAELWKHRERLVILLTPLFLLNLLLIGAALLLGENFHPVLEFVAGYYVLVTTAVIVHRQILVEEDKKPDFSLYIWSGRQFRFTGYMVALAMILAVAGRPYGLVVEWMVSRDYPFAGVMISLLAMGLSALLLAAFVVARFGLVFPSTAVDRPTSPRAAWQESQPYAAALFWSVGALPILIVLGYFLFGMSLSRDTEETLIPVTISFIFLWDIFSVALLSTAYRFVMD